MVTTGFWYVYQSSKVVPSPSIFKSMRDHFELVEISAYLIAVALALPIIAQFRDAGYEVVAVAVTLFYVLPFPVYAIRLNRVIPEWLDRLCMWHLQASWIISVLAIIFVVVSRVL